jgi:hypothetical protein
MAFKAELSFGTSKFDVLKFDVDFSRDVDSKGRPSSNVYGGKITVNVESTADTSILEQMLASHKPNSGSIVFSKGDEEAKMKELTWENGYIIHYHEDIDIVGSKPMGITFTVSAQTIGMGDAKFKQNWPTA